MYYFNLSSGLKFPKSSKMFFCNEKKQNKNKTGWWNGWVTNMSQSPCPLVLTLKIFKDHRDKVFPGGRSVTWCNLGLTCLGEKKPQPCDTSCHFLFIREGFFLIRVNVRSSVFAYFILFCDNKGTSVGKKKSLPPSVCSKGVQSIALSYIVNRSNQWNKQKMQKK